ncbi:unnamed protein product [Dimorphilus gyrociliatus]|uniref:Uncharacterized protein n=1 Tax=Dimorphilus gyrociliatus TaxID=2664684 RepID=A0A7I8W7K6_9ANNE|nr:unnamed protein product [Dimorphilus gyrociliatus]
MNDMNSQLLKYQRDGRHNLNVEKEFSLYNCSETDLKRIKRNGIVQYSLIEEKCEELSKFRRYLASFPKEKSDSAIYYLVKTERSEMMIDGLINIYSRFNKKFNYPIILFHEQKLSQQLKDEFRNICPKCNLFFQLINFTVPTQYKRNLPLIDKLLVKDAGKGRICSRAEDVNYRTMCRFQSFLVYEEPILDHLEYIWRLDDDSRILSDINYDVFNFMRAKKLLYGWTVVTQDEVLCVKNLWEAVNLYVEVNLLNRTCFFHKWPYPLIFMNNFEISSVSLFKSDSYTKFISYLDNLGGIYRYRWGDAPIKTIAVSLFVSLNQVHYFEDIEYNHGGMRNPPDPKRVQINWQIDPKKIFDFKFNPKKHF